MIVIPSEYEESPDAIRWRFFTSLRSVQNDSHVIPSEGVSPTRNLLLPTRNGGDCTLAWREILQGKAFQNDMCFSLRCFTAAQHDNQMLFRVYTRNLLFLFATVMIESFLLYEILHITAFCSE